MVPTSWVCCASCISAGHLTSAHPDPLSALLDPLFILGGGVLWIISRGPQDLHWVWRLGSPKESWGEESGGGVLHLPAPSLLVIEDWLSLLVEVTALPKMALSS